MPPGRFDKLKDTMPLHGVVRSGNHERAAAAPTSRSAHPFRGQADYDSKTSYSDEQKAIIESNQRLIVANAFAGTGKTTTAVGFAAARPNHKVLYMPFGKSVQMEAVKRFPPNTICQTINSAAYAATIALRHKLSQSWPALTIRKEMNLMSHRQAGIVHNILNQFMVSADRDIGLPHGQQALEKWRATEGEIADAIAVARLAWRRMRDPSDAMPVSHDALLKIWSLSNPKLNYDVIIFDEAQDTNPVTASIIKQQQHAVRLYIGDRHQSIYRFRGAANAMEEMGSDPSATHFFLSKTWRFGPRTAEIANTILGELKGETVKIIGMGQDGQWKRGYRMTKLSRSNAQLFREAVLTRGKGVYWVGKNGIEDYGVDRLLQAYAIFKGNHSREDISDPVLRYFRSWSEAVSYGDDAKDQEIRVLVGLIEEFRHDIPDLVTDLRKNQAQSEADADVVLTTAHKSKGLDWDYVQICDDFEFLEDLEAKLSEDPYAQVDDQEINLLYVAATRAKREVMLNKETAQWLEDLPQHRQKRMMAKRRVDERREASRNLMRRYA
mgnify:CR=1 FL=1